MYAFHNLYKWGWFKQTNGSFPLSPDWLIGLVTDVEAPSLELDDVSFLQVLQTGISKHLLLQLRE